MLGRHVIYIRELNECIIFIVFKGNDLHSGFHPSYTAQARRDWLEVIDDMWETSVERIGLVAYPNRSMSSRTAGMSISPPLHFGNHGEPIAHHTAQLNFSQHARGILGNAEDHFTRLGREAVWSFANLLSQSGLSWEGGIEDLYRRVKYTDENKEQHQITAPTYDIHKNQELVRKMRGYWQWYETYLVLPYYIRWTKASYYAEQGRLQDTHRHEVFSAMEMSSVTSPLPKAAESEAAANTIPIPNIQQIISRSREGGETVWTILFIDNGISGEKKITDKEFKKIKSQSALLAQLELNFMNRNVPSSLKDILGPNIPMDVDPPAGAHIYTRSASVLNSTADQYQTAASPAMMGGPSDSSESPLISYASLHQPSTPASSHAMERRSGRSTSAQNGKQKESMISHLGELSKPLNFC